MRKPTSIISDSVVFKGRIFPAEELELIHEVSTQCAGLSLTELSRTVCELLQWKRPNGRLKNHECRLFLEQLEERGLVRLPALRALGRRGPRLIDCSPSSDPQAVVSGSAGEFEPLRVEVVAGVGQGESRLWREYLARYHYLGYRVPVGANLRYWVRSGRCPERVLGCLLWTSAAWKMAARDRWIGWTDQQRRRNLPLMVNNARFLILPWVHIRGLASKILAHCARQLPGDWEARYGYRPLLLETLVDPRRFRGTCYRAANWIYLGVTQGRGRMDREGIAHRRAVKDIYVYPLARHLPERLRTAPPPVFGGDPEGE